MREELQAALTACGTGGTVSLAPGEYRITRAPDRIQSLILDGRTIAGNGAVLRMVGSGIRPDQDTGSDWTLLEMRGESPAVRDLLIDADGRTDTNEQTHLIQVKGPANGTVIERVHFRMPRHGHGQGGDCIRLLGAWNEWVNDTTIRQCVGIECDRSFIGLQRGVNRLLVERCQALKTGDQAFDCEATGTEGFGAVGCIKHVRVRDCHFSGADEAGAAVTIGGRGQSVADDIVFERVSVEGGGIDLLDCGYVTLKGVAIHLTRGQAPALQARRRIGSLRLIDCSLSLGEGSGGEAVVKMTHLSGHRPAELVIVGGSLVTRRNVPALKLEGCQSAVIVGTRIVYEGEERVFDLPAIQGRHESDVVAVDVSWLGWLSLVRTDGSSTVRTTR